MTANPDLTTIIVRMRRAFDDVLARWSEQNYNQYLDGMARLPSASRDPGSRPFGYAMQGWPFTPTAVSAARCPRCGRRASRCVCPRDG